MIPAPRHVPAALLSALAAVGPALAQPADKARAPIPAATLALMAAQGTDAAAPMLLRAYKKESEIELWKRAGGRFVHVRTYPICRWSGGLGPKTRNGDRQTPEGFYSVAKGQMNPNSRYHLSFDIGYPNAYDRAHGATGSAVMVHGICSSMGCFAMTDAVAGELFAVAREAFAGGQAAFQFQSYPFRMRAEAMARHRADPNAAFWRQLKEGSDRFEATGLEPVVTVASGRYAFAPLPDRAQEARAQARVGEEGAREARAQARVGEEAARTARLVEAGAAAVRTTYADGGQHAFWAALIDRGVPVGPVSRPEALAFAGLEEVLIPERPRPDPLPAAVWTALLAPGAPLAAPRAAGFAPAYAAPADRFAFGFPDGVSSGGAADYTAALPAILRGSLRDGLPSPIVLARSEAVAQE